MGTYKTKEQQQYSPLDALGPFDLVARATLERLSRQKGGMDDAKARSAVDLLIETKKIKITKKTGLLNDCPLFQKNEEV